MVAMTTKVGPNESTIYSLENTVQQWNSTLYMEYYVTFFILITQFPFVMAWAYLLHT